ncbi:MAG: cytochrome P450 [Streptosporangiaceae bacterium]
MVTESVLRPSRAGFPLGASVTIAELTADPHPVLRRLRGAEPVSWLPALDGWLVSRADLAGQVLRDSAVFTVDDSRFTTARIVGPSMLSLDGAAHRRHRDPFARSLRTAETSARLAAAATGEAARLVSALAANGATAELRRALAGPLAVAVMADMLDLDATAGQLLAWYDAIVAGVSAMSAPAEAAVDERADVRNVVPAAAAAAFGELSAQVEGVLGRGRRRSVLSAASDQLAVAEVVSNAAVLLFGGIETTEGMICNALWYLLTDQDALHQVRADRSLIEGAVDESLRLEPAAAVVDRYATADVVLGAAQIQHGELVVVSLAGANRDPVVFADPDRFDVHRANARQHLAFAVGPHFCIGAQLARLEATAAVAALLDQLTGLHLDPARPSSPQGLVFRKPPSLHVCWDA